METQDDSRSLWIVGAVALAVLAVCVCIACIAVSLVTNPASTGTPPPDQPEPEPAPTVDQGHPPEPTIHYPVEALVGAEVRFDASQSRPGSSPIASYEWSFGVGKAPSADLWAGQTDEGDLGHTYQEMDQLLFLLVEEKLSPEACIQEGFSEKFVSFIVDRVNRYRYKSLLPLAGSVGQFPLLRLEQIPAFSK